MKTCKDCGGHEFYKNGRDTNGNQKYKCKTCKSEKVPYMEGEEPNHHQPSSTRKHGISISDFRRKHDVAFILEEVFSHLEDNTFYERSDIVNLSGLRPGYPGLTGILDSSRFKKFRGKAGGQVYYARPELIEEMREEGIIHS